MILARRKGEWFLAVAAPHIRGCNLSIHVRPLHDSEHFHVWQGTVHVWSHVPRDGITFFPELRYRGVRVFPGAWKRDSAEPILSCLMPHPAGTRDDPMVAQFLAIREELLRSGWEEPGKAELASYIHVDDLEKIEGPPPEGAF